MADATTPAQEKRSYKATLNLPKTDFPMKANLVQNEPASIKRWQAERLYEQVRAAPHPGGRFVFHDGPPYANGSIHLGHLLNKVLKDIVVRSKTMEGYDVPYVPGWDCHGLPIEHKVVSELGDKAREMDALQIRRKCRADAEKFVKLQAGQMQRLLTLADYEHPYLTLAPEYEAAELEVFADLVERGLVYRALKPVHWSIANRTALAEAELEYYNREDTSVYVLFDADLSAVAGLPAGLENPALMIWTTTPWTLPANLAVAVHPEFEYGVYRLDHAGKRRDAVLARELAPRVLERAQGKWEEVGVIPRGEMLRGVTYRHPFIDRSSPVVTADYVTLEDGTGLVHTAPGHGVEDYQAGLREGLPIYSPVRADGTFDDTAPEWLRGADVWEGNGRVVERLRGSGHLFHAHAFTHSYPHDWRSKTPVIFRATEQWFIGVDKEMALEPSPPGRAQGEGAERGRRGTAQQASPPSPHPSPGGRRGETLRALALASTDEVRFYPDWGRNRLRGMLESRPDWCISRQKVWGLPIPAFFRAPAPGGGDGAAGGQDYLLTPASVRAVAANIRKHGSDLWFKASPHELLAGYDPSTDPDAPEWAASSVEPQASSLKKSSDIFDVWVDSGSSWNAVVRRRFGDDWVPTDLYLEGSDQHRGWFQTSLLLALGATGRPPFKRLVTHGFMVDRNGEKISKSNAEQQKHIPTLDELFSEYGADIARWWVASVNTDHDIKVDKEYFKLAGEEYRKVRNTIKYLLSNLYDYPSDAATEGRSDEGKKETAGNGGPRLAVAPQGHSSPEYEFTADDATSIDAWVLSELDAVIGAVRAGFDAFEFPRAQKALFNFCNETLSAVYLAATKDRMYCDRPDSSRRRRSQRAMHLIADALIRMAAPIMPHTADEAWRHLRGKDAPSVHLELFPEPTGIAADPDWPRLMADRGRALKFIEEARGRGVDNPLDLGLEARFGPKAAAYLTKFDPADFADLCGISRFHAVETDADTDHPHFQVLDLRSEPRCERSWKRDGTVKPRSDGGMLTDRDADALGL